MNKTHDKTMYELLCDAARDGKKVIINLSDKSAKVNGKYIIEPGKTYEPKEFLGKDFGCPNPENCIEVIENLYNDYLYSTPSENDYKSKYFYAKEEELMTTEQLIVGIPREFARVRLEAFILCTVLSGVLRWSNVVMGHRWFWKSERYKELILIKDWIEIKEEI